jgi:hypothetical protein
MEGAMHEVQVKVRLDHLRYMALVEEAKCQEIEVEILVERFVQGLIRDLTRDEDEGTDHPIVPA